MPIPPEPIIKAARRWLEHLPAEGLKRARSLLTNAREYADLTPTQYAEALSWIQATNLVGADGKLNALDVPPDRLLEAIIIAGSPPWLADADLLINNAAEVPDDAMGAASGLGLSPDEALVVIERARSKVDLEARRLVGDSGEREVLRLLTPLSGVVVDHVASWSDAHGYDVSVTGSGTACHLEVKSTTRSNRRTIYLSRNEFETMRRDPAWVLAIVILDSELALSRIFQVSGAWVLDRAPKDTAPGARWESVRLDVPAAECIPGVSALLPLTADPHSPLLTGTASTEG